MSLGLVMVERTEGQGPGKRHNIKEWRRLGVVGLA